MDGSSVVGRGVRTARNQAMFRAVSGKVMEGSSRFDSGTVGIACECSGTRCTQILQISSGAYAAVRRSPHRFIVSPEHVDHDVERLIVGAGEYAVVELFGTGGIESVRTEMVIDR